MPLSKVENIDCMIGMKQYPDKYFELAIVDPPYGINRDEGFEGFEGFGGFGKPIARKKYKSNGWDENRPDKNYFDELQRVSQTILIFGGNFFSDLLPVGNHWIVWDKKNTMPTFGDAELIYTNVKRNSVKIYQCEYNGLIGKEQDRIHATQKPIKLYRYLINNYAKQGDKILDSHLGSGSSRIAAFQMGFDFTGYELDKDYFEASEKRFRLVTSQTRIEL